MSENTITTFSDTPYNDDFHSVDPNTGKTPEQKNYLRILYKPGVSVQTRELNQMQSIIQSQIDKFGHGVFSDGAAIIEGEKNFDNNIKAIDVTFNAAPGADIDNLKTIRNENGLKATVIKADQLGTEPTEFRLFIRYENSYTNLDSDEIVSIREFENAQEIYSIEVIGDWASADNVIGSIDQIKYAALAKVESGVFFTKGEFVLSEEQVIYMIKPAEDYLISGKVAFRIDESQVNSGDDPTLLDNAAGTPNFNAPGADRYAIDLNLIFISDYDGDPNGEDYTFISDNSSTVISKDTADATVGISYSHIANVIDGNIQENVSTLLSENINGTLATRTSEESGDYTVKPFVIDIREFYNDEDDDTNRGLYNANQIRSLGIEVKQGDISGIAPNVDITLDTSTTDEIVEKYGKSRLSVGLEQSVAYVDGYRISPESKIYIDAEKARTTNDDAEVVYTTARLGNYIQGNSIVRLPEFGAEATFYVGTNATNITGRIRGLEYVGEKYRLYLYDLSGPIPSDADQIKCDSTNTGQDFEFNFTAGSGLNDAEYSRSIYDLPYDEISDVDGIEMAVREEVTATIGGDSINDDQIRITLSGGARFFDENENSYIVMHQGEPLDIDEAVLSGTNNNTVTLTIGDSPTPGGSVKVLLSYKKTLLEKRKESVYAIKRFTEDTSLANGNYGTLTHRDVYKIREAYYVEADENINDESLQHDITDEIILDDGQRDGVYKLSRVRYTGLEDLSTKKVHIAYDYFSHSEEGDFYSKRSYINVDYEDIPSYNDERLSDVLDFRPDGDTYNTTLIDPNSVIQANVFYYLNRVDSIVVNNLGEFSIIRGNPALIPVQPETPDNSMLLYVLDIPAYTFDVSEIDIKYIENRRYTMRDIGEIDKRVKNLEYYTSLSLLEREANEKQIIDDTGSRFKNGILVDSFSGHSVGDTIDSGYLCSIDANSGKLRPSFTEDSKRFILKDESINSYGDLATLRFDATTPEVPFIEQLEASTHMSVNPYAVAAWWGEVKLSPSSDEWKETSQRPDVIIDRRNDAATLKRIADARRAQGTIWGSWRTNWTGFRPELSRNGGFKCANMRRTGSCRNHGTTWTERATRTGIRTTATVETVRTVVNNKVIDTSFVPFIRSRKVYFKGKMFRPNTKIKIFFDDVDISSYATLDTFVEFKKSTSVQNYRNNIDPIPNASKQPLVTNNAGEIEGYFIIPNNAAHKFRTGEREVVFTDVSPNNNDATTTATAVYSAKGVMEHKQRTVVSSRRVNITRQRLTQNREQTFWQGRRWGPRSPQLLSASFFTRWRDPLAQSFMIGEIETGLYATSIDLWFYKKSANVPVQIHLVTMDNGYPTQEQLPFSEVTLNPDQVIASLDNPDISEREKPWQPTNFAFESPVYLQAGVEYAIVVLSNDDSYRMWLSDVGKESPSTGKLIAKNPYTGVMFKSQNASTWTADQNKDFMFRFNRAKFDISTPREIEFNTIGIGTGDESLTYSQLSVIAENITLAQTNIQFSISDDGGDNYYPFIPGEDIYLSGTTTNNTDIKMKAVLSSESEYITPFIDLDRVSLNSVHNYVNSEADLLNDDSPIPGDSELEAIHGNAFARYITRTVDLNNPADQIDIYLNINRPTEGSDVKVYARFGSGEENIKNIDFIEILPTAPIEIPVSSTEDDFREVLFEKNFDDTTFTSFQIKIVMLSDDHANVPVIEDFRAIATT